MRLPLISLAEDPILQELKPIGAKNKAAATAQIHNFFISFLFYVSKYVIYRIPFCFGNLMVRRKKIHKGCRKTQKDCKKSLNCLAYYASFIKKQDFLARFRK
ncbi:hypothetical protein DW262_11470 [Segatella copri]|uniref:Uncharacterized protein n=1 Tax=Segatella copri TaxID=165179 RepID=A0A3R6G4K1_9BACT|nr:hypothetical protein DW263_10745 [Segatella copri]RHG33591.1 hypothetical protein DW262_11470 [Segatella copri]RHG64116.1 hypothetical protein DW250_11380 [Segatella copri]